MTFGKRVTELKNTFVCKIFPDPPIFWKQCDACIFIMNYGRANRCPRRGSRVQVLVKFHNVLLVYFLFSILEYFMNSDVLFAYYSYKWGLLKAMKKHLLFQVFGVWELAKKLIFIKRGLCVRFHQAGSLQNEQSLLFHAFRWQILQKTVVGWVILSYKRRDLSSLTAY